MEEYYYVPLKENPNTFVLSHNGSYKTYNEDFSKVKDRETIKFTFDFLGETYGFVHPAIYRKFNLFGEQHSLRENNLEYFPIMNKDGEVKTTSIFYSQNKTVNSLCRLMKCLGYDVNCTCKDKSPIVGDEYNYPVYSYGINAVVYVSVNVMDYIKKVGFENTTDEFRKILHREPLGIEYAYIEDYWEAKGDGVTFNKNGKLCTKIYRKDLYAYVYYSSKDVLMDCIETGHIHKKAINNIVNCILEELKKSKKKYFKTPFKDLDRALNGRTYGAGRDLDKAIIHTCIIKVISEALRCGLTI